MLDDGEKLVPGFRQARALRVWTGVRPLFEDAKASDTDTRDVTRAHALLDHRERDGVERVRDDHRRQAHDLPADGGGDGRRGLPTSSATTRPCTTATEPLPGSENGANYRLGERLARKEAHLADEQLICECEMVPRAKLEEAISAHRLDQPRRHPPAAAARDGAVPGRVLHLPRDRDPARARRAHAPSRPTTSLLRLPAGALEGRVAGPVRRPAAPGAARRVDLPGRARRRAPAPPRRRPRRRERRAALRRGRDRRRHRRPGRRDAAGRRAARACACSPRASARRTWRPGRSTCSATRPSASRRRAPSLGELIAGSRPRPSLRAARRRRGGGGAALVCRRSPPGRCRATPTSAASSATCCCPTAVGALARRRWCPRRWPPATPRARPGRVVGTPALRDFHPSLCAANLTRRRDRGAGDQLEHRGRPRRREHARAGAAASTIPPGARASAPGCAAALRAEEHVGLPAMLGLRDPHAVWSDLEQRLGPARVRDPDAAAVGSRDAAVRDPAPALRARRRAARARRRGRRRASATARG